MQVIQQINWLDELEFRQKEREANDDLSDSIARMKHKEIKQEIIKNIFN